MPLERHYILDQNNVPVPAKNLLEWGDFFNSSRRILRQNKTEFYFISTVFLGMDYGFGQILPPQLFESIVFSNPDAIEITQQRYCNYDKAIEGHEQLVNLYQSR